MSNPLVQFWKLPTFAHVAIQAWMMTTMVIVQRAPISAKRARHNCAWWPYSL
jgi:hypothetical protein